jgi:hypothetical protein
MARETEPWLPGRKAKTSSWPGVEAEDIHYQWMREHLADNGVTDEQCLTIHGPASDVEKDVFFTCGHATERYGQTILPSANTAFGDWPKSSVKQKRAVSIVDSPKPSGSFGLTSRRCAGRGGGYFPRLP